LPTRALGKTGLRVGVIGLGTVKLGRERGLKYPGPVTLPSDEQAIALLTRARALGVTLIDTAPAYGQSERRLGELLWRVGPREAWTICTKVGEVFDDASATSTHDFSPGHIRASVEESCRRLRVQTLDVVLLHFASTPSLDVGVLERGEALGELEKLRARGLVRFIGASTGSEAGGVMAARLCDAVMLSLSADVGAETPGGGSTKGDLRALTGAGLHRAGVLAKKPLESGRAADPVATIRALVSDVRVHCAVVGTASPAHLSQLAAAVAREADE
jgi:aryl-alcohol dehydrogenase-like predicted oxidoreductase